MTLHKLWTKMSEKDWRTIIKSFYILHCISRDSSSEACQHFSQAMKTLARTRNPKKPDQRYFDLKILTKDLDTGSQAYQQLIKAYSNYVFYRVKNFDGKFIDVKEAINQLSNDISKNSESTSQGMISFEEFLKKNKKQFQVIKRAQQAISMM